MFQRAAAILLLGFTLSGCITAANTLSPEQVSSFRLQAVEVSVAPNARIWWGDGERAYAQSRGITDHEAWAAAVETDAGRAYVRNAIAEKLRSALMAKVGPELTGVRPVRLTTRVHKVRISPAIQRLVLGGDHRITADVELLDGKTGAALLSLPSHEVVVGGGGGLIGVALDNLLRDEPIDLVTRHYAQQYRNWLLRK